MANPPADVPSPGNPSGRVGLPPPSLTPLIGREHAVAEVGALLAHAGVRLLTLIGPGGVGKTRLALEVARQADRTRFERFGIAPLAAIHDHSLVPQSIALALGVPGTADQMALDRIRETIADRQVLLVIDNLEHLPKASPLLVDLLTACPNLTILATSRARLNVSGERLYPVQSLDMAAAVSLFLQRGQAVMPDLRLDASTQPHIEAICSRIDCLPLAIELAAARLTVLPLPDLLTRLAQPLDLLTGGPYDAPDRQRTMRDVIAWSYNLLRPGDQAFFRRLSVFVGGFTLDGAAAVAGGDSRDVDALDTLIANCLAHRAGMVGGVARFSMLETIREFALEALADNGEEQDTRRRHAAYLAHAMEQEYERQDGPELRAAHDRINAELQNCRAALAWCQEHGEAELGLRIAGAISRTTWYVHTSGDQPWHERMAENQRWVMQALAVGTHVPLGTQIPAMSAAVAFASLLGDADAARSIAHDLLERSFQEDNALGLFWGHSRLGFIDAESGEHDAAREHYLAALAVAPELPHPDSFIAQMLAFLAQSEEFLGDIPSARSRLEEAMTLARQSANPFAICLVGSHLGRMLREAGDLVFSAELQAEAIAGFLEQRRLAGVARALSEIALIADAGGLPKREQHFRMLADRIAGYVANPATDNMGRTPLVEGRIPLVESMSEESFVAAWRDDPELDHDGLLTGIADLIAALRDAAPREPAPLAQPPFGLTPRELEVLLLLATGRANRSIADELSLSERTIENHLQHIYGKLGVESRTAAVAFAHQQGLT